ncbi:MAG: hypothetical protein RLZZ502_874 [Pseudomonadota bacterium]|jgi:hypothetical protein
MTKPSKTTSNRRKKSPPIEASENLLALAEQLLLSTHALEHYQWQTQLADAVHQTFEQHPKHISLAIDKAEHLGRETTADVLLDACEQILECRPITLDGQKYQQMLVLIPILLNASHQPYCGKLPPSLAQEVLRHLNEQVMCSHSDTTLHPYLYRPEQFPDDMLAMYQFSERLFLSHQQNKTATPLPSFESDDDNWSPVHMRCLFALARVPEGKPFFKWQEQLGQHEACFLGWREQASKVFAALLPGCQIDLILPGPMHHALEASQRQNRFFVLASAVNHMFEHENLSHAQMQAILAEFKHPEGDFAEIRISLKAANQERISHGLTWIPFGDENAQLLLNHCQTLLNDIGVKNVLILDESYTTEYCDDCGSALFPDEEGELHHLGNEDDDDEHSEAPPIRQLH